MPSRQLLARDIPGYIIALEAERDAWRKAAEAYATDYEFLTGLEHGDCEAEVGGERRCTRSEIEEGEGCQWCTAQSAIQLYNEARKLCDEAR